MARRHVESIEALDLSFLRGVTVNHMYGSCFVLLKFHIRRGGGGVTGILLGAGGGTGATGIWNTLWCCENAWIGGVGGGGVSLVRIP